MNVVFLFDVDNTLLDNDRVAADLRRHLDAEVGADCGADYWALFQELRSELGYADYLGALQRYRIQRPRDLRILDVSHFLVSYPFVNRLFPGSLDALDHCARLGRIAILSDGDVVFQPRKISRSGLYDAVDGNVMIYVHKEHELDDVEERYPADHYVLVDDKVWILAAVKAAWGARVTTVFVRQGHYAADAAEVSRHPAPDVTLAGIAELVGHDRDALVAAAAPRS
jgi:FMN phosphatase YigB (HAD superfamily)